MTTYTVEDPTGKVIYRIREEVPVLPDPVTILQVPWVSQLGPGAAFALGDCGPACAAMVLNYLGRQVTVDQVSIQTGLPRSYKWSSFVHIKKAFRYWGIESYWARNCTLDNLRVELDNNRPVIVLVDYDHLPVYWDANYAAKSPNGHFILLVGYSTDGRFHYHDPYYPNRDGAFIACTEAQFEEAWGEGNRESGNSPRQIIRIRV